MEIGDNFASLIKKVRASRVPEDIKDILTGELNTIRNKVFRYIQEETSVSREDKKEHDSVNHPQYYCSHPSGVECIDITRHYNFAIGNAIKYLWRAGLKKEQGMSAIEKEIEDCKKAIWYINDHIKHLEKSEFLVNGEKPNGKTF